jgi:hypothetical protein
VISEENAPLVSYDRYGGGSVMRTTYNEPELTLDYADGGLDRLGRIVAHAWQNLVVSRRFDSE